VMDKCHCGANFTFEQCCQPYLSGVKQPPTAESLMRSRYSAFVVEDINYIKDTMTGEMLKNFSYDQTLAYAQSVTWQRLNVIASSADDPAATTAWVEFEVYYILNGIEKCLYEYSSFERMENRWFYIDSEKSRLTDCGDKTLSNLGRNDKCHCGSGKKYKKCCL
jgi:SEC-C motif domain protein